MTALFSAGAVLLRGAGCTINDIWDRKVDAKVERTKNRPIASGRIMVPNAVAFLGAQLGLGSVVLYQLDFNTQILGLMSLPLVATYPLMKRVTNLPQLFLGFTFNWGALMGWTAITGGVLEAPALALYGSGVLDDGVRHHLSHTKTSKTIRKLASSPPQDCSRRIRKLFCPLVVLEQSLGAGQWVFSGRALDVLPVTRVHCWDAFVLANIYCRFEE